MDDANNLIKTPSLEVEQKPDIDTLINDEIEISHSEEEFLENIEKPGFIRLPHGNALTVDEIYRITSSEDCKIITFVGPFESGKTTIETTLYQLFQSRTVGNLYFSGSETILGYEERSFDTRLISKNENPATPRTSSQAKDIFLHLRLFDIEQNKKTSYLFADISGEALFAHKGNTSSLKENLPYLKSSNDYVFVLDGRQLSDKFLRNGYMESMKTMARTIFDAELYSEYTSVQIVISKYDRVSSIEDDLSKQAIAQCIKSLESLISRYVNGITVHNIAAMPDPKNNSFEVGHGLNDLLNVWKGTSAINQTHILSAPRMELKSQFNKLNYKLMGGLANE